MKYTLSIVAAFALALSILGGTISTPVNAQGGNIYQPGIFYQPRTGLGTAPIEVLESQQPAPVIGADSADPVINHNPPLVIDSAIAYIILSAEVTDDTGVDSVTLTFSTSRDIRRHTLFMDQVGATKYKIALPHRREGTVFRYYISAVDRVGNTVSTKEYTLEKLYDRYDDEQRRTVNRYRGTRVTAGGSPYDTRATRSRLAGRGVLNIPQPRALSINRAFVPTPPTASANNMYTVKGGDSLGKIAQDHLGTGDWRGLWNLNKDQISDPNLIRPGMVLRLR